jgi:AcrR family transcriptional regulator
VDVTRENPGWLELKTARTKEQIFQAAIELFAERGVANVTVEQITKRAGVGKGTFYHHFRTKEGVIRYFGNDQLRRLQEAIDRGEIEGSPRDRIQQILQLLAAHPSVTPDLARGLFIAGVRDVHVSETDAHAWEVHEIIVRILNEGQEQGCFDRGRDSGETALFLFGQYYLGLLTWCTSFTHKSLYDIVTNYAQIALDGLTVSPN